MKPPAHKQLEHILWAKQYTSKQTTYFLSVLAAVTIGQPWNQVYLDCEAHLSFCWGTSSLTPFENLTQILTSVWYGSVPDKNWGNHRIGNLMLLICCGLLQLVNFPYQKYNQDSSSHRKPKEENWEMTNSGDFSLLAQAIYCRMIPAYISLWSR